MNSRMALPLLPNNLISPGKNVHYAFGRVTLLW
jgi:hypothetical protein